MKSEIISTLAWSPLFVCLALVFSALASSARERSGNWPVRDEQTIRQSLPLDQPPMRLIVDNVDGYVHVKGVPGQEVRITAHKIIHAEADSDLAQARSEVRLNISGKPGAVTADYDAPWRCRDGQGCHNNDRRFYNVTYDIDVEVPAAARTYLSTVNNGDITLDESSGDFDIKGVNGGIHMSAISGSGSVRTVNGPVTVHFTRNPERPCEFKSVNGSLDAWFQNAFSADLLLKVFNGQVYSDFDVTARAIPATSTSERHDGMFVYKSRGMSGARVGSGGPELSFDTLNGSIRIHREK